MLLKALNIAENYVQGVGIEDHKKAASIDRTMGKAWKMSRSLKGERRYAIGESQASTILESIRILRDRLACSDQNKPLDRALVEIGYATTPTKRLFDHSKHTSSNYLMNLMEAISS